MHILEIIFGVFALLGAADRIFGNHLGLGKEFEKGILSIGALALAMVGMISIAPTIAKILVPVCASVANFLRIDLSFVGGFIANDMGGAMVAKELATDAQWGGYNGLIVASMMGVTICFTIPVALKTIEKKYHKEVLSGILCGIATVPLGCIVSGLIMGYPFPELLLNLLPTILVSLITGAGIVINGEACRKIFNVIGNFVLVIITIGLGAGIFTHITGVELIPYMNPVSYGFETVGNIAILLAGVFPLIYVLSKLFQKLFHYIGGLLNINDAAVVGLISSFANSIPTFALVEKMNPKGIVVNMAFAVSASFVFGDHLAFTMAFDKQFVFGMIIGKLVGGVFAVIAAHLLYHHTEKGKDSEHDTL